MRERLCLPFNVAGHPMRAVTTLISTFPAISLFLHNLEYRCKVWPLFSSLTWSKWGSSPLWSDFVSGFSWNHTEKKWSMWPFFLLFFQNTIKLITLSALSDDWGRYIWSRGLITAQLMRETSVRAMPGRNGQGQDVHDSSLYYSLLSSETKNGQREGLRSRTRIQAGTQKKATQ